MIETYKETVGGSENERIGYDNQHSAGASLILAERERLLSQDAEFAKQHRKQSELNEVDALLAEIQAEYKDKGIASATTRETEVGGAANEVEEDIRLIGQNTDTEKDIIEARKLYR